MWRWVLNFEKSTNVSYTWQVVKGEGGEGAKENGQNQIWMKHTVDGGNPAPVDMVDIP